VPPLPLRSAGGVLSRGTEGSNPPSSGGESGANRPEARLESRGAIGEAPLVADHKHPIGREERILMKLIVDAGTDRAANRPCSVMLRDDANPYQRRTALSVRSLSLPAARCHRTGPLRARSLAAYSDRGC
jgi:hypothetical protein